MKTLIFSMLTLVGITFCARTQAQEINSTINGSNANIVAEAEQGVFGQAQLTLARGSATSQGLTRYQIYNNPNIPLSYAHWETGVGYNFDSDFTISRTTASGYIAKQTAILVQNDDLHVGINVFEADARLHIDDPEVGTLIGESDGDLGYFTVNRPESADDAIARFRDAGTTIMRINPNSYSYQVEVNGDVKIDGDLEVLGMYNVSDEQLKKNVRKFENAIDKIQKLRPATYEFRSDNEKFDFLNLPGEIQFGFIAQELEMVFPNLVKAIERTKEDGEQHEVDLKAVNYTALVPVLVAGMQEQQIEMDALRKQNEALEDRLERLEALLTNNTGNAATSNSSNLATQGKLQQNQPNPFSENTLIRYTIPEQVRQARLKIINLDGKVLKTITLQGQGAGQATFDAGNLPSGTYLYSLILDGKMQETKQMIVTK